MAQSIPLWGVVTPAGEPIIGSLYHTAQGATYRYGALSNVPPIMREDFWRRQEAKGYHLKQFTLHQEKNNG